MTKYSKYENVTKVKYLINFDERLTEIRISCELLRKNNSKESNSEAKEQPKICVIIIMKFLVRFKNKIS